MKLPKIGMVKYRGGDLPDGRLYCARVFMEAGKWFVAAVFECPSLEPSIAPVERVGIDMGIKSLATVFDGENVTEIKNGKALRQHEVRLARYQRILSRRQKGSKRRELAKRRVASLHQRIANIRNDACHKATTAIVGTANTIVVESLNVKGMMKNGHLAKALGDASMSTFLGMLKYKSEWYGRSLIEASQWMPSSKTCSRCGQLHDMPLKARWMSCDCGNEMDRDENAARNLYAYREELGNVCDMETQKTRGETGGQILVETPGTVPVIEPRTHAKRGQKRSAPGGGKSCVL
jgi:putative transposase